MSSEKEDLRSRVEDSISALVQAGHGNQAIIGAWTVCAEVLMPGKEEGTVFMHDRGGSALARRGLIECVRGQLSSWVEDCDD